MNGLAGQFELAWALADLHLSALDDGDFLWEPADTVWTVRPDGSGRWLPDWSDAEPDPIPVPTIGWLTWHVTWWWSVTLAHLDGEPVPDRTEVTWPGGAAVVARIRELAERWRAILDQLTAADLDRPSAFPWGPDSGRTVADTALWLHVELTKNVAEIGQLRLLRAVSRPTR
ncbi:DinB family protein [Mycolicibacterium litorale]|uniref:DNA damage-inducible protein DinB n=1 Tax=Mycolicibacterium litorale TaxID=758802 RepID=A0AAD1IL25_9MYCO|nr:DinB family protein [Mycolicibacterium litorale]MCV7414276.1 DinB family protein [Mycolicibacterium litorale]TDY02032.1 DinB family protein [Mycolicibacterium litorale]BBY15532.1 DNA damage-inducible protein DinB [Mycolicibacterium litorale]